VRTSLSSALAALLVLDLAVVTSQAATFDLSTATVPEINAAFAAGALTAERLTELCLARIQAYDQAGPKLNAMISVHPKALELARELDAERKAKGPRSPLHGIPVILKDNYNTFDLPTTGGSKALATFQPTTDASTVARLRAAGALILGKANLGELARTSVTLSSLGGQTLNPYDLTRTPGGSSGGSGVAVAASFGILSMGTDTGQSIRSPASATAGVGLRGTFGLIGRSGVIPNTYTQDAVGPNTRTVTDAAIMADVLVGFDAHDPSTWNAIGKTSKSYAACLHPAGLNGARIGFVRNLLGDGTHPEHAMVTEATMKAVQAIQAAGATVVSLSIPEVETYRRDSTLLGIGVYESARVMNQYFAAQGPSSPFKDLTAYVAAAGDTVPSVLKGFRESLALLQGPTPPDYLRRLEGQAAFRDALVKVMNDQQLDALFYTHQRRLVVPVNRDQLERNGFMSSTTGLPALTVPGGFSPHTTEAPIGVPVGVEFLGRPFAEPTLIRLAYGFEQATRFRQPPVSTPALPGERFDY
jgi:amidase